MEHIAHGDFYPSGTIDLTTIPRASNITATDAKIGSSTVIVINRASDNFTHTVSWDFSGLSGTIAEKTTQTTLGWTVPTSIYQKIPESQSATITITCKTYNGNTLIGTSTTTMQASVPEGSSPIIDTAEVIDTNTKTIGLTGSNKRLVQYKSIVKLTATGRCLNYAGFKTFREMNIYELTTTSSTNNGTTTVSGEKTYTDFTKDYFRLNLVDTRSMISQEKLLNEANGDFVLIPYIPLTVNINANRKSPTSNTVQVSFSGNFFNGYFDTANNKFNGIAIKWRYKKKNGDWITTGADDTTYGWHNLTKNTDYKYGTGNTFYSGSGTNETTIELANIFSYTEIYTVEFNVSDQLSSVTVQKDIPKGEPCVEWGETSDGKNYFNVNGEYYKNSKKIDTEMQIKTGEEYATNEYIDGKRVYIKQLEFNDTISAGLDNRLVKSHGIVGAEKIWVDLSNSYIKATTTNATYPLPVILYSGNISALSVIVDLTNIYMEAQGGWGTIWTKVIRLKYTKNNSQLKEVVL